ncbi:hypothetical protein BH10ACI1_BH10ACI1_08260 [soil metagenome]
MRYKKAKKLKDEDFKRFYGVRHKTFQLMCQEVKEIESQKTSGRHADLTVEDQVLLTLSYWREYRTMFHLGQDYDLHESNVSRIIRRVEDILIKCRKFSLPGKRRLLEEDELSYTIVDVTEMMIEEAKKNKSDIIREKRSGTP